MRIASVGERSQQAERLEQMKSEFLVAQQRRRDQSRAAGRPVDPDHDAPPVDERADAPAAAGGPVRALEPCH